MGVEVPRGHRVTFVLGAVQQGSAALAAGRLINVHTGGPPRFGDLHFAVKHVADDHGLLALGAYQDDLVSWAYGRECARVTTSSVMRCSPSMSSILPRSNRGLTWASIYGLSASTSGRTEVFPIEPGSKVPGVGKGGSNAAAGVVHVPADVIESEGGCELTTSTSSAGDEPRAFDRPSGSPGRAQAHC